MDNFNVFSVFLYLCFLLTRIISNIFVTEPWAEVLDDKEREAKKRAQELMERLKARSKKHQSNKK